MVNTGFYMMIKNISINLNKVAKLIYKYFGNL